jgi:hypothetical protein
MSCTEILLVYFVNNWCVRCTWCNIDNIGLREKNQEGTNTDFGFPWSWIFLPQYVFVGFYVPRIVTVNRFQSNLFYILHDIPICLSSPFFVNLFFFNAVFCVCSFLVFFSQPDVVNITSCTSDTSIVDKIDQKNFGAGHLSKLIGCLPRKAKITHQSLQLHLSLIYLHSEISSDGVCVFFSSIFYLYCITFTYLHLYLKSVYLS